MTFERLSPLPADYCAAIRSWCDSMRPQMQETNSRFAPGRKTLWLINAVHLGTGEVTPAPAPEWLYRFVNYLLPGCDAVQLSCGAPIDPHRDHKVFSPLAVGINLGEAKFLYQPHPDVCHLTEFHLWDGDMYRFDSKRLHGSRDLSPDRYSLNLWTLRPNYRPAWVMPVPTPNRERDFLEANLGTIESLLSNLTPSDFVLREDLESRREELRERLQGMGESR